MAERRRRGHGEGSIYRLHNGRWRGMVDLGWTDGKRRRRSITRATRSEVAAEMRTMVAAAENGRLQAHRSPTLGEWLDTYLAEVASMKVRPNTLARYEQEVRLHLRPALGHRRLDTIRPRDISDLYQQRSTVLSPASIRRLHAFLRRALTVAVRWELLDRNPALAVDPPALPPSTVEPFTRAEAMSFALTAREHRLEARWLIGLILGLRQGEVLGLRWNDVDLDRRTLSVAGSLQRRAGGVLVHAPTKTRRSNRVVPMGRAVERALRRWADLQTAERHAAGQSWEDSGFVFTTSTGRPISPRNDYRAFQALLSRGGLRRARLHDLRHTAASMMVARGIPARVVMEVLGHSQVSVTLNTYTHVDVSQTTAAVDQMTDAVDGSVG